METSEATPVRHSSQPHLAPLCPTTPEASPLSWTLNTLVLCKHLFFSLTPNFELQEKQEISTMSVAIPSGGTYFDTLKKSFVDVPVAADNKISTTEFLEAAESLLTLFGMCRLEGKRVNIMLTWECRCSRLGRLQACEE